MKGSIAIIPARGGSKRIPRKNIKEFCGRPIIEYPIKAAIDSGIFETVMVSTDDNEIADIAKKAGAEVPFMRSEKTSGDYATTADVLFEVIENYKKLGREFLHMFCIYPTAPFVTADKLINAMNIVMNTGCSEIMPVVGYSYPPQRCLVIRDNMLQYRWPEYRDTRSQDLEKYYYDCGQFYYYNVNDFIKNNGKISKGVFPLIVPETEVQDIDTQSDWELAEIKYQMMIKHEPLSDIKDVL